jgi:hypothetical protein
MVAKTAYSCWLYVDSIDKVDVVHRLPGLEGRGSRKPSNKRWIPYTQHGAATMLKKLSYPESLILYGRKARTLD